MIETYPASPINCFRGCESVMVKDGEDTEYSNGLVCMKCKACKGYYPAGIKWGNGYITKGSPGEFTACIVSFPCVINGNNYSFGTITNYTWVRHEGTEIGRIAAPLNGNEASQELGHFIKILHF